MRIRRRHLHKHYIQRQRSALEKAFDLAQENRSVVGAAVGHGLAHILTEKQSAMAEMPFILRARVVRTAQRLHVNDFHVAQLAGARHQRVDSGPQEFRSPTESKRDRRSARLLLPLRRSYSVIGTLRASS